MAGDSDGEKTDPGELPNDIGTKDHGEQRRDLFICSVRRMWFLKTGETVFRCMKSGF